MKNYLTRIVLIALLSVSLTQTTTAQTWGQQKTIQVNAETNATSPYIKLKWNAYASLTNIQIFKMSGGTWPSTPLATLSGSTTEYTDSSINVNEIYEYKITGTSSTSIDAFGYIAAGVELDELSDKGVLVVIVDSLLLSSLSSEMDTYMHDAMGDGYQVIITDFDTSQTAAILKDSITAYYNNYSNLTSVFLVGALPYAYTGKMYPDGHPDHRGAWPSDLIFADVDGSYSDAYVSYTNSTTPRLSNATSDAKTDQSYLASAAEIQIGRLDLSRLPAFSQSETALYQNYFAKLHAFKTGAFDPAAKAIVDDHFTGYSEGFSQNGYRNFSPLTANDSVVTGDIRTTLNTDSVLWTFAAGAGSYTSINGFATTAQLASTTLNGTFALVMGSYNGDPDVENNFMRAMLANGNFLTTGWAGRPNWFMQHMGLGKSIGNSTLISQNNSSSVYEPTGYYAQMMHVMLLGDPSLKNHYTNNVTTLSTIRSLNKDSVYLTWTENSNALGYNIYRSKSEFADYELINSSIITNDSFIDVISPDTSYYYRIETVEMVQGASGSYNESSVGEYIFSDKNAAPLPVTLISFTGVKEETAVALEWVVADEINFSHYSLEKLDESTNTWNEVVEIHAEGTNNNIKQYNHLDIKPVIGRNIYRLKMVDFDASFEYSNAIVVLFEDGLNYGEFNVYPTVAKTEVEVECDLLNAQSNRTFFITDVQGKVMLTPTIDRYNTTINISALPQGIYFVSDAENNGQAKRIIKAN